MLSLCAKGESLLTLFFVFIVNTSPQYENYSFRSFPREELVPLTAAYGKALDTYAAGNWTESIRYLELSLRLHRLLQDSAGYCVRHCNSSVHDKPSFTTAPDLHVQWQLLMTASCQKKCREHFPALQLPPPSREVLEDFRRRSPYRYLHHAHSKVSEPHLKTSQSCFIQERTITMVSLC